MSNDKVLLEKFKKVMRMSNRISIARAAKMMQISEDGLNIKLFDWGDDLSFKIEDNSIVVSDIDDFSGQVDALFTDWGEKEESGDGKVVSLAEEFITNVQKKEGNAQNQKEEKTGTYHGVTLRLRECQSLEA